MKKLKMFFLILFSLLLASCGGNSGGGAPSQNQPIRPTLAPITASDITYQSAVINGAVTAPSKTTITERGVCYGASTDISKATCVGNTAGTGPFSETITGLSPSTVYYAWAYAKYWAGNEGGKDISWTPISFKTLAETRTIHGNIQYGGLNVAIFLDGQRVDVIDTSLEPNFIKTYNGTSGGKFQFILDGIIDLSGDRKSVTVLDANGNNAFTVSSGGNLTLGNIIPNNTPGGTVLNISGSNYAPSIETGVCPTTLRIRRICTASNNNNVPVGATMDFTKALTQSGYLLSYDDPDLGTLTGTINGKIIYVSWKGYQGTWLSTFWEYLVLNAANTYATGNNRQTWNESIYVFASSEAWRQ